MTPVVLFLHLLLIPIFMSENFVAVSEEMEAILELLEEIEDNMKDFPRFSALSRRLSALEEKMPPVWKSEELFRFRTLVEKQHFEYTVKQKSRSSKIVDFESRLEIKSAELDGIQREQNELIKELDRRLRELEDLQDLHSKVLEDKDLYDLGKDEFATKVQLHEVENRVKNLQTWHDHHEDNLESNTSEFKDLLHGLGKDMVATEVKLQEMENRVQDLQTRHDHREDNLEPGISKFTDHLSDLGKDEAATKVKIQQLENRVQNLQTQYDRHEAKETSLSQQFKILESRDVKKNVPTACLDAHLDPKEFYHTFRIKEKTITNLCPLPYVKAGADCLLMGSKAMMWPEARTFCIEEAQKIGGEGDLAVPTDRQAFAKYLEHLQTDDLFLWIGASDAETEGKWKWVTGDTIDEDFPWATGRPASTTAKNYMCVSPKKGSKYYDFLNTARLQFICQLY